MYDAKFKGLGSLIPLTSPAVAYKAYLEGSAVAHGFPQKMFYVLGISSMLGSSQKHSIYSHDSIRFPLKVCL